jgi:hypothetical protein
MCHDLAPYVNYPISTTLFTAPKGLDIMGPNGGHRADPRPEEK